MRLACACVVLLAGGALYAQTPRDTLALDVVVEEQAQGGVLRATDFTVADGDTRLVIDAATLVRPSTDTGPLPPIGTRDEEMQAAAQASRIVGVYVDEYHLRDELDRPIWHRRILLRPDLVEGWWIWQLHDRAAIDGIEGGADLNVMRGTAPPGG